MPRFEQRRRKRTVAFRLPSLRARERLEKAVRAAGMTRSAWLNHVVALAVRAQLEHGGASP